MRPGVGRLLLGLLAAACHPAGAGPDTQLSPPPQQVGPSAGQAALPGAAPLEALAWLAGTFRTAPEAELVHEEVWTEAGGGTMFGVARSFSGSKLVGFEWLRIEARGDAIVYVAHPNAQMPGTEFTLEPGSTADTLVFVNAEHDFPTHVIYERQGATRVRATARNEEHALVFAFDRQP